MPLKLLKVIFRLVVVVALIGTLAAGSIAGWIAYKPRSLPEVKNYLVEYVKSRLPGDTFEIKDAVLKWGGLLNGVIIDLEEVVYADSNSGTSVEVGSVSIDVAGFSLLTGKIAAEEVHISGVKASYKKPEETNADMGDMFADIFAIRLPQKKITRAIKRLPVDWFTITQLEITELGDDEVLPVSVRYASLERTKKDGIISLLGEAEIDAYDFQLNYDVKIDVQSDGKIVSTLSTKNMPAQLTKQILKDAAPVTADHYLDSVVAVTIQKGRLTGTEIKADSAVGQEENFGIVMQFLNPLEGQQNIKGRVYSNNMPSDKLESFWPIGVAPRVREWILAHVEGGHWKDLELTFEGESMEALDSLSVKDGKLQLKVAVEGGVLRYSPDFPPLTETNASMVLDKDTALINIHSAKMMESEITDGKALLTRIEDDDAVLTVDAVIDGAAKDTAFFLKKLNPEHSLSNIKLQGESLTGVTFSLPVYKEGITTSDIQYEITTAYRDIKIQNLIDGIELRNGDLTVVFSDKIITMGGSVDFKDSTINIYPGVTENPLEPAFHIQTTVKPRAMAAISNMFNLSLAGELEVLSDITFGGDYIKDLYVEYDASPMQITQPMGFAWDKNIGIQAHGSIQIKGINASEYALEGFTFNSENADIIGGGKFNFDNETFELAFDNITLGKNYFGLSVKHPNPSHYDINLTGSALDFRSFYRVENIESDQSDIEKTYSVKLSIDNVLMSKEESFQQVEGKFECKAMNCSFVDAKGLDGDQPWVATYKLNDAGTQYDLLVDVKDAGGFIRGLGILDNIHGGSFTVKGSRDVAQEKPLVGEFEMSSFTVRDAPTFARILTLASFSNLAKEKAIGFDKATGKFEVMGGVLGIKKLRASSNALAVTIKGDIDIFNETVDLGGTVIPANIVNILLDAIPGSSLLLGDSGLVAANYSVDGTFDKRDVSVNPFSILTPGVLREIWGN